MKTEHRNICIINVVPFKNRMKDKIDYFIEF